MFVGSESKSETMYCYTTVVAYRHASEWCRASTTIIILYILVLLAFSRNAACAAPHRPDSSRASAMHLNSILDCCTIITKIPTQHLRDPCVAV